MMETFDRLESEVRGYCRAFPTVFETAEGARMTDEKGRSYLDFFAGAGVLNYGHNHPLLRRALLEYVEKAGVTHTLDMASSAKREFLEKLERVILKPRGLDYKVQFPGPTGTNAVESALKLARKATGRQNVLSFTNAFHGMTLGSLAVTGNAFKRAGAGVPLPNSSGPLPYDGYMGKGVDTLEYLETLLKDSGSGVDKPAAVILETVQAEGGVNPCSMEWLKGLRELTERHGILLILDDIQVGCGRTGPFFSFEPAGITPDIVCLSKSLSGYGLPLAVVLMRPELDVWEPGEHNGTFRGHNLAFVTAAEALSFWEDDSLSKGVEERAGAVRARLEKIALEFPTMCREVRGRGLIQGLDFGRAGFASKVSKEAFRRGLVIETAGAEDQVLKLLPPLNIDKAELEKGLDIVAESVRAAVEAESAKNGALTAA